MRLSTRSLAAFPYIVENSSCNLPQWQNFRCASELNSLFGHTENHRTLFVLRNRIRAGISHFQQPLATVRAHSRQNYANCIASGAAGNRLEHQLNRGSLVINQRAVLELHHEARTASFHDHMLVARSNKSDTRSDNIVIASLAYLHLTNAVESFCKRSGESLWHVLDDHRSGSVGWYSSQYRFNRGRSACRSADRENRVSSFHLGNRRRFLGLFLSTSRTGCGRRADCSRSPAKIR